MPCEQIEFDTVDFMEWIEWDDLESAYMSNLGHTWKKYNDIPQEYHSLVKPMKPAPKRFKAKTPYHHRSNDEQTNKHTLY